MKDLSPFVETAGGAPAGFDLRFSVFLRDFGGDFLTPDGKLSALDSPAAKEAFKYVIEMVQVDKTMPPGVVQVDANGVRRMLVNYSPASLNLTVFCGFLARS